jgi:hypothetical protein
VTTTSHNTMEKLQGQPFVVGCNKEAKNTALATKVGA